MKCAVRRVVKVIRRCTREFTIEKKTILSWLSIEHYLELLAHFAHPLITMVRVCVHLNSYINLDKGIWVSKVEGEERK